LAEHEGENEAADLTAAIEEADPAEPEAPADLLPDDFPWNDEQELQERAMELYGIARDKRRTQRSLAVLLGANERAANALVGEKASEHLPMKSESEEQYRNEVTKLTSMQDALIEAYGDRLVQLAAEIARNKGVAPWAPEG